MNTITNDLVRVWDDDAAARVSAFQVRRVDAGSMDDLCRLVSYLACNRSLRLVHIGRDEELGMVTAYLSGDALPLELLRMRVETVFPEAQVSLAPGFGRRLSRAV